MARITDNDIKEELKRQISIWGYTACKSRNGWKFLGKYGLLNELDQALFDNNESNKISVPRTVIL